MYKLLVFVAVALLVSESMGFRVKRQSADAANPVQPVVPRTSTTAAPPTQTTLSAQTNQCITDCPVTSEYNPVCGSNRVLYPNPGRLLCAQACGVNVTQLRFGLCPTN